MHEQWLNWQSMSLLLWSLCYSTRFFSSANQKSKLAPYLYIKSIYFHAHAVHSHSPNSWLTSLSLNHQDLKWTRIRIQLRPFTRRWTFQLRRGALELWLRSPLHSLVTSQSRNQSDLPSKCRTFTMFNIREEGWKPQILLNVYNHRGTSEFVVVEGDTDDAAKGTSSELVEIDHAIFATVSSNSNESNENDLPVFETTNGNGRNRPISNAEIVI